MIHMYHGLRRSASAWPPGPSANSHGAFTAFPLQCGNPYLYPGFNTFGCCQGAEKIARLFRGNLPLTAILKDGFVKQTK
jgi:hypothetical protein